MNTELIRILIIEDEVHNSRMLKDMVAKLRPFWKIDAVLESVEESVEWLDMHTAPDLILMDIQLSDGICFSIFKHVKDPLNCAVIFTTAYDEYAVRAFKVNSIDYLLKPVTEAELESSFIKFEQFFSSKPKPELDREFVEKLYNSVVSGKKEYRTRFLITGIKGYQMLEVQQIAYFYSDLKQSFAVDFLGREYTLEYNLEQLEQELNPADFFRANRKTILNIKSVVKILNEEGGKLLVKTEPSPNFEIIISRLKAMDFKIWMGK